MDRHGICTKHGLVQPEDIYTYPSGEKKCRKCGREYMTRYRKPRHVPRARLRLVLEDHLERSTDPKREIAAISLRSGVSDSVLHKILSSRESDQTRLGIADKILCAMGLVHLWFIPAEKGGFADIYAWNEKKSPPPEGDGDSDASLAA